MSIVDRLLEHFGADHLHLVFQEGRLVQVGVASGVDGKPRAIAVHIWSPFRGEYQWAVVSPLRSKP